MRKYYGITETINGNEYRVEIWDAPSGSATGGTQLNMGNPGFVIDYDGEGDKLWENPLRNSRINAYFVVSETTDHDFFQSLAVADEGKSAIVVYKNSNLFYVGRIIPDGMQYERRPEKNTVYQIAAVDGLSLLSKYKVDYDWFDSNTQRLDILKLVRESLKLTAIPDYYDHLGASADYMVDASKNFPTGEFDRLNVLEINLSSVINDLDEFMLQTTTGGTEVLYVDCKTAIERVLLLLHCRLIYTNGSFYIFDPVDYGSNYQNFGVKYSTNGTQGAKLSTLPQYTISNGTRPTFEAFPIHSHQPAVREIRQNYTREAFNRVVRNQASPNNQPITITTPSIGAVSGENRIFKVSSVLQYFTPITPQATKQKFIEISFRAYVTYSGGYKHYNYQTQSWDSGKTAVPGFEKIRAAVTGYEKFNSSYRLTIDFQREFQPPTAGDDVTVDISVGTMQWSWAAGQVFNPIFFTGVLCTYEIDNTNKSVIKTNNKYNISQDVTVSDKAEYNIIYGYEYSGNTVNARGTIWNSSTNSASGILAGEWAQKQLACYIDAPKTASATLVDDGDYYPILSPQFDSDSYIFSGGSFTAQDETWEFELLKVEEDVENVNSDELDYQDTIGGSNQQKDAVRRVLNQTNTLRDSVSSFDTTLPTDIIRLSDDSPTSTPTYDTLFTPYVKYDATDEDIVWSAREEGKSKTITSSETFDDTVSFYQIDTGLNTVQLTLPLPSTVKGKEFTFKKTSPANTVELAGTIDGGTGYFMDYNNETVVLVSDGSEYIIKAEYGKDDLTDVTDRDNTTDNTVGVGALQLNLTPTATPTEGMLYWDEDEETAAVQVNGINYEIGQGLFWVAKNQTGVQIDKGTAVYASGTLGSSGRLLISPMIADGTIEAKYFLGITAEDIANGDDGKVITQGKLRQLDTSAFTAGNVLWVSASTAGDLTSTQPTGTNDIALAVAFVVNSHTNGMIAVRVSNLDENDITDIPTLDEVTTEGNTTTNDIEVGDVTVNQTSDTQGVKIYGYDDKSAASAHLFVNSAGNTQLVTSNPSSSGYLQLQAQNYLELSAASLVYTSSRVRIYDAGQLDFGSSGDYKIKYDSTNDILNIHTDTNEGITIGNSGNVGIGTTSPSGLLSLAKGTRTLDIKLETTPASNDVGVQFRAGAADYLGIAAGGNSGVGIVVDSSNNVGIGTSSPNRNLTISDSQAIIALNATSYGNTSIASDSVGSFVVWDDDASAYRMVIKSNGNVLIGTTTDNGSKLQVNGYVRSSNSISEGIAYAGTGFEHWGDGGTGVNFPSNDVVTLRTASTDRLYINSSGNIGIGTTSPSQKLSVDSGSNAVAGYISVDSQTLNRLKIGYSFTDSPSAISAAQIYADSSGNLDISSRGNIASAIQLYTSSGTSPAERMRITSSGNVGIGTTSPSQKLSVATDTDVSAEIGRAHVGYVGFGDYAGFSHIDRDSAGNYALLQASDGETFLNASSGQQINFRQNNVDKMRLFGDGNFAIGTTTNSGFKLDVNGTATFRDDVDMRTNAIDFKTSGSSTVPQFFGHRSSTDLDSRDWTDEAGWAYTTFNSSSSNTPSGSLHNANGLLSFNTHVGDYGHQIAMTTNTNKLYFRTRNNAAWQSWQEITTDSKDFIPSADSTYDIGSSSVRFANGYFDTLYGDGSNLTSVTATDPTKLPLTGGTLTGNLTMSNSLITLSDGYSLRFGGNNNRIYGYNSGDTSFVVGGSERMRINSSSGNVGIGTTSPAYKLDVAGNASVYDSFVIRQTSNAASVADLAADYTKLVITAGGSTGADHYLAFQTQVSYTKYERARFTSGGNLLIGTTTDNGYKLAVSGGDAQINGVNVGKGGGSVAQNTIVGYGALTSTTTGNYNTALGFQAGYSNTTGERNTAIGRHSLYSNSTGSYNTAIGYEAGRSNTTGSITAVGYQALKANTTGGENVAIGRESMRLATASQNTAVGTYSGYLLTSGSANTIIGRRALFSATTAGYNVAIGAQALYSNVSNNSNVAVGEASLYNNTQNFNTAVGNNAARNNTTGSIVAVGYEAGYSNTTGTEITAIGRQALMNYTGSQSTALGYQAGYSMTTPSYNTVIGRAAAYNTTTGHSNTVLGRSALYWNTGGSQNISIGINSLVNTSGSQNTAIGSYAGDANTTGSNNIFIGFDSEGVSVTDSNRTWIGNSSTTSTWVGGNLLVGTTTDGGQPLQVKGSNNIAYFRGDTGYSDITFSSPVGNEFHMTLGGGDSLVFNSTTNERMRLTSAGNLGLGTSSPSQLLHLSRTGSNPYIRISSDSFTGLDIGQETSAGNGVINLRDNKDIRILTNGTDVVRIKNTGYVGLGTTSPARPLHVSSIATSIIADFQYTGAAYSTIKLTNTGGNAQINAINSDLTFAPGGTERMRLLNGNGNVGIGTSSPQDKLSVAGDISTTNGAAFQVGGAIGDTIIGKLHNISGVLSIQGDATRSIRLGSATNGEVVRIDNTNSRVGIGTTSPSNKLHIVGDLFLKGTDNSTSTKVFQVQTGNGTSIMDFRNDAYAFFGCGQGGGSASGFIFRYNSTFGVQFTGYNYGNGTSPSYKPILMDTDLAGRSQGVYVNYGITGYTAPAPTTTAEFAVRGRGTSSSFTAKFEDSSTNPLLYIKDNGNVMIGTGTDSGYKLDVEGNTNTNGDYYVNNNQGWSGNIVIDQSPNPAITITVEGGIITNVT